ncbi:MAG: hypothetical protein KBS85_08695 [Lachnospiraceae bacterium]|nr:hypothetical protein [Candidatus Merdinaster equi]
MEIKWLNDIDLSDKNEPMMALVAFDASEALVSLLDDGFEHHILLAKMKENDKDLDKYFRIIFDRNGADWTFICPNNYDNISNKEKRIDRFYKDGFRIIGEFLTIMKSNVEINIPKRYRRHIDYLTNNDF